MTALLTDNLPLLAGAPNGIKKLRELILELAIRGKLLPQDPNDEPAIELLQPIAEEKARLVRDGKLKKQKPSANIDTVEKPSDFPKGWLPAYLADIVALVTDGDHQPPPKAVEGVPFLVIGNLNTGNIRFEGCRRVPHDYFDALDWGRKPCQGDILYTVTGSFGIPIVVDVDEPFCVQRHVAIIKTTKHLPSEYLRVLLASPYAKNYAALIATGIAQKTVPLTGLRQLIVPLPPLAEQHRIVAKVDELMALCDRLEAQQANSQIAHTQLVQALLDSLAQASDAIDFATNWQRLAEHFHSLFTTEPSIDALKQTLLQLAVMGKLVSQDANDEPAENLYERIQAEKHRLVTEGLLKKQKTTARIAAEDIQLTLPSTWKWVPLLEITTGMDSGWSPTCLGNSSPSDDTWGVLKTTAVQIMSYLEYENKELPSHLEPRPEAEAKAGDILFTRAGPMNRVGISCLIESTRPKLMISDKIIRFHPLELGAYGRFIALCLNAGETAKYLERAKSGMAASQVNISQEKLRMAPIPLAPLSEQHRIVAKVDQLMILCDQLKTRLTQARQLNEQLASTLVEQAASR